MQEKEIKPVDVSRGIKPTAKAEKREMAEPCRIEEVAKNLGKMAWFIIVVHPGEEFRVVDRLDRRGVFAFTPTVEVWRKWSRYDKKKTRREFAAAPRYVAIGHPRGAPIPRWATIFTCEGVSTVLGMETHGYPKEVSEKAVEHIAMLCTRAKDEERFMRSRAEFSVGDMVHIAEGPFEGMRSEVQSIFGADAVVMLNILGSARQARISLGVLEKVDL